MKRKRIESLQIVRALACIGIFASHSEIKWLEGFGPWGVSIFLVLSGFLMVYNHLDDNENTNYSILNAIKYGLSKIKKLYPLYVISMTFMVPFLLVGADRFSIAHASLIWVLNLGLIQEWVPLSFRSPNAPGWFLDAILLSYIVFPLVMKKIGGVHKKEGYSHNDYFVSIANCNWNNWLKSINSFAYVE